MRYGAICKALHVLPRLGGVLDQPAHEIVRLERILDAYAKYEDYQQKRSETRDKNRTRHSLTKVKEEIH